MAILNSLNLKKTKFLFTRKVGECSNIATNRSKDIYFQETSKIKEHFSFQHKYVRLPFSVCIGVI